MMGPSGSWTITGSGGYEKIQHVSAYYEGTSLLMWAMV